MERLFSDKEQETCLCLSKNTVNHLRDDFFEVLDSIHFQTSNQQHTPSLSEIEGYLLSVMKLLCIDSCSCISCLLLLEKYSSAKKEFPGSWKQFVGIGLLIVWKMTYRFVENEKYVRIGTWEDVTSLIKDGELNLDVVENKFLSILKFNVILSKKNFNKKWQDMSDGDQTDFEDYEDILEEMSTRQTRLYESSLFVSSSPSCVSTFVPASTTSASLASAYSSSATPASPAYDVPS